MTSRSYRYLSILLLLCGSTYLLGAKKGALKIKTVKEFNKVINDMKPAVITFVSPTCGACTAMEQTFNNAADTYADKVLFAQIDVNNDNLRSTVDAFGVNATPTIFYKELGTKDKDQFKSRLESHFGKPAKKDNKKNKTKNGKKSKK